MDGSQRFPWVLSPAYSDPREGAIAPDATLVTVRFEDQTPVSPEVEANFQYLQEFGDFCK